MAEFLIEAFNECVDSAHKGDFQQTSSSSKTLWINKFLVINLLKFFEFSQLLVSVNGNWVNRITMEIIKHLWNQSSIMHYLVYIGIVQKTTEYR